MIIALFASGIKFLYKLFKKGGFLLTNNHHNDALDAMDNDKLITISLIIKSKRLTLCMNIPIFFNSVILKIIAELSSWKRHSDEEINHMVTSLKKLREQGKAVIYD